MIDQNPGITGKRRGIYQGLSLVEVIISATILALIMMTLFNLFPASVLAIQHAGHRLTAANLAQSILEEKRAGPFTELYAPPDVTETLDKDGTTYTVTYLSFNIAGYDENYVQGIRATITWKERERECSVSQELYVCKAQN